jgi:hypothetical protein
MKMRTVFRQSAFLINYLYSIGKLSIDITKNFRIVRESRESISVSDGL